MSFVELIAYISTAEGIQAAIGFILSWVADFVPQWNDLPSFRKRLYVLLLSLAIPLLGSLLAVLTGYAPGSIAETWWPSIEAGFAAFVASQARHMLTMRSK